MEMQNQQYPYESLSGCQPDQHNVYDGLQQESDHQEHFEPQYVNVNNIHVNEENTPNQTSENEDMFHQDASRHKEDNTVVVASKASIWKLKVAVCVLACLLGVSIAVNVAVLAYSLSSTGPSCAYECK